MKIYIDENISKYLAEGLNLLQKPENIKLKEDIEVIYLPTKFNIGVQDEDWIPLVGKEGGCVITQDINIKRTRHQWELCQEYELGMFFLKPPSKKGFSYWDMTKIVVKHWEEITKKALTERRPFGYKLTQKGKLKPM